MGHAYSVEWHPLHNLEVYYVQQEEELVVSIDLCRAVSDCSPPGGRCDL